MAMISVIFCNKLDRILSIIHNLFSFHMLLFKYKDTARALCILPVIERSSF